MSGRSWRDLVGTCRVREAFAETDWRTGVPAIAVHDNLLYLLRSRWEEEKPFWFTREWKVRVREADDFLGNSS